MTAAPIFPAEPLIDAIVTHDRIPFDEPPDTASHIARGLGYIAGRYGGSEDKFANHWRRQVEMDGTDPKLLGEDEWGDLWVPSRSSVGFWDRRFSPWRPTHWRYYARSRRLSRLAMIECQGMEP